LLCLSMEKLPRARACRSSIAAGVEVAFEFCDAAGNLVRAQRANHTGFLPQGTYMPIFYDAQNPSNCVPACALNYELVLPESMAATDYLGRSKKA
jgi:hypothetical protein